jgi:hypothetical protein
MCAFCISQKIVNVGKIMSVFVGLLTVWVAWKYPLKVHSILELWGITVTRPLFIEFPGAICHVTSRGNAQKDDLLMIRPTLFRCCQDFVEVETEG